MIHLVTSRENKYDVKLLAEKDIYISTANDFRDFIEKQEIIQLDTETNVVDKLFYRELYVVQIGDYNGEEQWIFDITDLSGLKLKYLKDCLNNKNIKKVIHNAMFEYSIIQKTWGIDIDKIRDTMLMSRVLYTGLHMPKGFHGLAGCIKRYFNIEVDKGEQSSFTSEPMTVNQIMYAAIDVTLMGKLHDALQKDVDHWGLENTVKLECAVVRPFADGLWNNLYLNKEKWYGLMKEKEVQIAEAEKELFSILQTEFLKQSEDIGFIQSQDTYLFSWGSTKMKRDLMRLVYPMMPEDCTTLPAYKKFQGYLKEHDDFINVSTEVLDLYLKRNFEGLERYFIQHHQGYLLANNLFIPKGRININFNSPEQVLKLFQLIKPDLQEVGKDTIEKLNHPLAKVYRNYKKLTKLYQSYGQNFLDVVDEDGLFRIQSINQIASTGRISMTHLQLLPKDPPSYRACFHPEPGWKIYGCDYSSQELVIAATLSKEESMLEALKNKWDMHSICASLMFADKWAALGEDIFPKGKPKTAGGKKLRDNSKTTTFGVLYGKSAIGLAETLDLYANTDDLIEAFPIEVDTLLYENKDEYQQFCLNNHNGKHNKTSTKAFVKYKRSLSEFLSDEITGDDLIQRFKTAFPNLNNYLSNNAEASVSRLHSRTKDVFGRIRFFEKPENMKEEKAIFRESMNHPIQSGAANMSKYACVLIKKYIENNNLTDKVKFLFAIHDEILVKVKDDFAEKWGEIQMRLMEEAGELVLENNLQKAEGAINDVWTK
jgi:DNA polymerase I-like protein with 3'-5' exonuclease and polymerase domains